MIKYINYCTEQQARRAYELGAPIEIMPLELAKDQPFEVGGVIQYKIPTTQQIIGWLEKEKNFGINRNVTRYGVKYSVTHFGANEYGIDDDIIGVSYYSEFEAIDAALDYLEKERQNESMDSKK